MVYGRILYNNIKEYTPKWYPTIPYSQTVKPTFSNFMTYFIERSAQVVSTFNSSPTTKAGWKLFARVFQQNSWMWQIFIFSTAFVMYYSIYTPLVAIYQSNNKHRTYDAAITKEKAHKKKLKDLEDAAESSEWSYRLTPVILILFFFFFVYRTVIFVS